MRLDLTPKTIWEIESLYLSTYLMRPVSEQILTPVRIGNIFSWPRSRPPTRRRPRWSHSPGLPPCRPGCWTSCSRSRWFLSTLESVETTRKKGTTNLYQTCPAAMHPSSSSCSQLAVFRYYILRAMFRVCISNISVAAWVWPCYWPYTTISLFPLRLLSPPMYTKSMEYLCMPNAYSWQIKVRRKR